MQFKVQTINLTLTARAVRVFLRTTATITVFAFVLTQCGIGTGYALRPQQGEGAKEAAQAIGAPAPRENREEFVDKLAFTIARVIDPVDRSVIAGRIERLGKEYNATDKQLMGFTRKFFSNPLSEIREWLIFIMGAIGIPLIYSHNPFAIPGLIGIVIAATVLYSNFDKIVKLTPQGSVLFARVDRAIADETALAGELKEFLGAVEADALGKERQEIIDKLMQPHVMSPVIPYEDRKVIAKRIEGFRLKFGASEKQILDFAEKNFFSDIAVYIYFAGILMIGVGLQFASDFWPVFYSCTALVGIGAFILFVDGARWLIKKTPQGKALFERVNRAVSLEDGKYLDREFRKYLASAGPHSRPGAAGEPMRRGEAERNVTPHIVAAATTGEPLAEELREAAKDKIVVIIDSDTGRRVRLRKFLIETAGFSRENIHEFDFFIQAQGAVKKADLVIFINITFDSRIHDLQSSFGLLDRDSIMQLSGPQAARDKIEEWLKKKKAEKEAVGTQA